MKRFIFYILSHRPAFVNSLTEFNFHLLYDFLQRSCKKPSPTRLRKVAFDISLFLKPTIFRKHGKSRDFLTTAAFILKSLLFCENQLHFLEVILSRRTIKTAPRRTRSIPIAFPASIVSPKTNMPKNVLIIGTKRRYNFICQTGYAVRFL